MRASTLRAATAGLPSVLAASTALVSAHSFPESEAPAAGQTLNEPPSEVRILANTPPARGHMMSHPGMAMDTLYSPSSEIYRSSTE
jgi:hypothetical protein